MNTVKKIAKNTAVVFISQIFIYAISFIYIIVAARYLGTNGFGIISQAMALTGILVIFADMGINYLIVREVARDKSLTEKYLGNSLTIKLILTLVTVIMTIIIVNYLNYDNTTTLVIYLFLISVIFNSFSSMFYSIFQAYEKMEYISVGQLMGTIGVLIGTLLTVFFQLGIISFTLTYVISNLIALIYAFYLCSNKYTLPKIKFDLTFWNKTIKEAIPFGLTTLSIVAYSSIDIIILSLIQGNDVVGWYNAAYKLLSVFILIPVAFNSAIFPVMSQFHVTSYNSLDKLFKKYFKYMIIVGIPLGIGTTLLANNIIPLIYGESYILSSIALQILIWYIVIYFARASFERLFESTNKQRSLTIVFGLFVIFNLLLNLITIPSYSFIGAAFSRVITELGIFSVIIILGLRYGHNVLDKDIILTFPKVLISAGLMGIFIMLFKDLNLFVLVTVSTILYFTILLIIKGFNNKEIDIFLNFLPFK
ncbi:flippase [Methanobacterium sp.]|uniref:flippase n=1 Tax=Methanobacterium sp. TaxID=2164 RepID=UPI003C784556